MSNVRWEYEIRDMKFVRENANFKITGIFGINECVHKNTYLNPLQPTGSPRLFLRGDFFCPALTNISSISLVGEFFSNYCYH